MRKLLIVLALLACSFIMSGCWFFDAEHNRQHMRIIKTDIREIHSDIDFILALEEESPLADWYFR